MKKDLNCLMASCVLFRNAVDSSYFNFMLKLHRLPWKHLPQNVTDYPRKLMILRSGHSLKDVWNMDETSFFYASSPD